MALQRHQTFSSDSPVGIGRAKRLAAVPIHSGADGVATAPREGIRGLRTFVEILANETRLTRGPVKLTDAPDSGVRAFITTLLVSMEETPAMPGNSLLDHSLLPSAESIPERVSLSNPFIKSNAQRTEQNM